MDISLEDSSDGIEIASEIRKEWKIPIIYLTYHTDEETIKRAKETGAEVLLCKDMSLNVQLPILVDLALYKNETELERRKERELLEESEEKFRSIASGARDGIIFFDEEARISFWNEGATRIFGFTTEEAMGKRAEELIAPDIYYDYYKLGFSNFESQQSGNFLGRTVELYACNKEMEIFPIELSLSKVTLKEKYCACGIIRDISARKATEEEMERLIEELQISKDMTEQHASDLNLLYNKLAESESQLKELNASKDKFFSIISHDLKNPFQGLIGYSEILAKDLEILSKEEIKDFVHLIHESSQHLYKLLENLLQWSRIQRGVISFNPDSFQLKHLIDLNISLINGNAFQKKIIINNEVDDDVIVFADVNMVNTVVRNLLSNAVKFTEVGGSIKISSCNNGNSQYKVSVIDSGVGMSKEVMDKIFRIDHSYTSVGTANEKGTGLGLILCKELVEKNGGTINVDSEIGKGTTFTFTLPQAVEELIEN
jgi:PAS domain S-box-containing protein